MNKYFLLFLFFSLSAYYAGAQQYSRALGIRAGLSSGFEYRFYTDDTNSYKILLGARDRGTQLTVLKEFHRYDIVDFTDQLEFVYGFGIHAGYERWDRWHYQPYYTFYDTRTSLIAGLDGLAALEYVFADIPVSVGLEVKPFLDVWGRRSLDVELFDFAFTVKYLF